MKRYFLIVTCLVLGGMGTYVGQAFLVGQPPAAAIGRPTLSPELTSYRTIVKKVLPAVVSIEAQSRQQQRRRAGDMQLPGDLRRFFDVPRFNEDDDNPARVGFGSGFLISPKGVVVTNNHVVEGADQVVVQLHNGRKFVSRTVRTDPKTDLAIVLLDNKDLLPHLEFGDSEAMAIGDRVLAVGAPFGLSGTVTQGIISGKGRSLRMNLYEDFLQTDAAINPGNSGGPLVNLEGKVIGINSAIKSRSGGFQGIGLAISSTLGKSIIDQLLKDGVVRRGYLGVAILDVDEETARELGLKEVSGVKVTRLYSDAPGDRAGMKSGDVIVAVGGKRVRDGRDLQLVVAGLPVGRETDVEIIRDGRRQTLKVTIDEQPRTFGTTRAPEVPRPGRGALLVESVGLAVADLTPELGEALGYPESVRGALITQIVRNGLAHLAGLRAGQVILAVDRRPITSARSFVAALADVSLRKGVVLQVRGPRTRPEEIILQADE